MFSLVFHFWTTIIGLHCKDNLIIHKTRPSSLVSAASLAIWSENTTVWYHCIKHTICAESLEANNKTAKAWWEHFPPIKLHTFSVEYTDQAVIKTQNFIFNGKFICYFLTLLIYCSDHSIKGITCPSVSQKCFVLKTGKLSGCQHSKRGKIKACKNHHSYFEIAMLIHNTSRASIRMDTGDNHKTEVKREERVV